MAPTTFKEAYGVLQQHAQTLRDQQEPNIDDLLNIVTQSVDAYKVCQARIEAAVARFEAIAAPSPESLFEHVYARWPAALAEQRDAWRERMAQRPAGGPGDE